MNFPECLTQDGRKALPENRICGLHRMYARHKPGVDWKTGDEYPDFSKIRSSQSFNWCAFSIPAWTRFNPEKIYQADYGVIGYLVSTIRGTNKHPDIPEGIYTVFHKPTETNYSHCELGHVGKEPLKKEKRAFRLALKNGCSVELTPGENPSNNRNRFEILRMLYYRLLSVILAAKDLTGKSEPL